MPRLPLRKRSNSSWRTPAARRGSQRPGKFGDAFRRARTSSQFAVIRFNPGCRRFKTRYPRCRTGWLRFRTRERRCRCNGVCEEVCFNVPARRIKSKKFAVIRFRVLGRRFTSTNSRFTANGVYTFRVAVITVAAVMMGGEGTKAERRQQDRQERRELRSYQRAHNRRIAPAPA